METSLHRQLKDIYAGTDGRTEVVFGPYRIDAINGTELVEIQHASLGAIRRKIAQLLVEHSVRVVKPLVVERQLIVCKRKNGAVVRSRRSPKRGELLDLFEDLVHFVTVFPHPRLTLEFPLVDVEEFRYPGHGRRRRWRRNDHQVADQKLVRIHEVCTLRSAADLWQILPLNLPTVFHTGQLATALDQPRHIAQRIAYCLRETGATQTVGKTGNVWLYSPRKAA